MTLRSRTMAAAAAPALLLALGAIGGQAAPARHAAAPDATTAHVDVVSFAFDPATTKIARGGTVEWEWKGSPHSVTSTAVTKPGGQAAPLFDSGVRSTGARFDVTFVGAGTYAYVCVVHPTIMKGTVSVPVGVSPATGTRRTSFAITWASRSAPAGQVFDVQLERPGSSTFAIWKKGQTAPSASFTPDAGAGTYRFRARLRVAANGAASGWSKPASIKVS